MKVYVGKIAQAIATSGRNIAAALAVKKYSRLGLLVGLLYAIVYLWTIGYIAYVPSATLAPRILVADIGNVWRLRAPFIYEPIAIIYPVSRLAIFVSIPNMIISAFLSALVGLNVTVAVYSITSVKACRGTSLTGILGSLPGFFTGFNCCVPTVAILLGSSFTLGMIWLSSILLPVSILALGLALLWNALRIPV